MQMFKDRMARAMIEPLINKVLHDLKNDPERSLRNVVDLILSFPNGRFSNNMFEMLQKMLTNENSAYYTLINKIVSYLDMENLKEFSINAGYNACTSGAKTIRELSRENNCCIPWILLIETDKQHSKQTADIIKQAKELGIYMFAVIDDDVSEETAEIIRVNNECAFVLFTEASSVSDRTIAMFEDIKNVLASIHGTKDELSSATDALRENHKFFAVHDFYDDENCHSVFTEEKLNYFEDYTETFLFCMPTRKCSQETLDYMSSNAKKVRDKQKHSYVMMDVYNDTLTIDKMISGNNFSVIIDVEGNLYSNKEDGTKYNINDMPLLDVLKKYQK
jgi:hypothetical protein